MNGNLIQNKKIHKWMIYTLKVLPAIMAFSFLINTACVYFGIGLGVVTHYLGLVIAPLAFIYISSYVFKFCPYHRWFVHYIAITELINITDWYWHIPISNEAICMVHFVISGIFLLGILIHYLVKKYGRNNK